MAIREWTCSECGTHHDRDVNTARNTSVPLEGILAVGRERLDGGITVLEGGEDVNIFRQYRWTPENVEFN